MEIWHIWMIAALLLVVVEIFTQGFAVICLAIGAVAAAVASAFSPDIKVQLLWFSVFTIISFVTVRPLMIKAFKRKGPGRESGVLALEGRTAVVSETIEEKGSGRVKVDGDDWKAVSENGARIEKGKHVKIISVNSVILKVREND